MKMYGNSYWNNATDNAEKSVITLSEEEFETLKAIINGEVTDDDEAGIL